MMKKRREELMEHVIGELSHTEAFVKKIGELLKQGLTVENYESTLQSVIGLCKGSYDLNRAGTVAMEVAEQQLYKSETFNLYCRMAGDLYKMQCESERSSGSTTMFSWLYNSATDAYLDGGYIEEAAAVAFQHSYWLMTNALSRDEEGKQTYLDLSVSAFYEIMKRSKGKLAGFIYEQREGRRRAADALQSVQPPAHLTEVEDPAELAAAVQVYRELIAYLEQICEACDIAAYLATELAAALKRALPELAGEYATLAEGLQQRHAAILQEHGIPVQGAGR